MSTRYDDLEDTRLLYAMHVATREFLQVASEDDGTRLARALEGTSVPVVSQPDWPDTARVYRLALEELVRLDHSGRVEVAVDHARHKAMATTGVIEAFTIITTVGLIIGMTRKIKVGGDAVLFIEFRDDLPDSMKEFLTTFVKTIFRRGGASRSMIEDHVPVEEVAESDDDAADAPSPDDPRTGDSKN